MSQTQPKHTSTATLLVVDDDALVLATMGMGLRKAGFNVVEAKSGEEAIQLSEQNDFDLALLDIKLPGLSGFETAKQLLDRTQTPFLFLSAYCDQEMVNEAVERGALSYLVKPIGVNQLIPAIETALMRSADINTMLLQYQHLNTALTQSREISVAIGIIMTHTNLSSDQAEAVLRRYARNTGQKMKSIAKSIISASEHLNEQINNLKSMGNEL